MLLKLWNSFLEECNHILRQEPSPSLGKKTGAEVTFILSVTLSISWPIIAFPYPCYWKYKTKGNFLFCIEVTSFSSWSSPQLSEFKGFWGKNQPAPGEKMLEIWSVLVSALSSFLIKSNWETGPFLPITRWKKMGQVSPPIPLTTLHGNVFLLKTHITFLKGFLCEKR